MDIDKFDWTPFYVNKMWGPAVISVDEYHFFFELSEAATSGIDIFVASRAYYDKLELYYHRFGLHMPIPIRKQLLRDLLNDAGT